VPALTYLTCICRPPQGIKLPRALSASGDLAAVVAHGQLLLMVVPTPFVASTMSAIRDKLRPDQARPLLCCPTVPTSWVHVQSIPVPCAPCTACITIVPRLQQAAGCRPSVLCSVCYRYRVA